MDNIIYLTALRLCPGVGNKNLSIILDFFNDAQTAWHQIPGYYKELGWSERQLEQYLTFRTSAELNKIQTILEKNKISVVTIFDNGYPSLLREIYNPPTVLFLKGNPLELPFAIAIVGSRRPTAYGKMVAEKLAEELAEYNIPIISGAARGIDTFAHKGALLKGKTIAVLGCGVDIAYPRENASLLEKITEKGTVVSEFPPGTPPDARHFPARNRIISGLANGVVVVEAAEKSGSLITSDFALEQGRDVFAVPGPITNPNSVGCHGLIKNGAKIVTNINDILEEYGYILNKNNNTEHKTKVLTQEEKQVIDLLHFQPTHFEEILQKTKIQIGVLSRILTQLELKNDIRQLPGQYYVLDKVNMG